MSIRFGQPFRIRDRPAKGGRVDNQDAADSIMLAVADLLPEEMRGVYSEFEGRREALEALREPL